MWYATYSIENYDGNGDCGLPNPEKTHDAADGFSIAVESKNLPNTWHRYNRRDAQCTAARWTGMGAEINYVDFLFYAGHGCSTGPIFGCNSGYPINAWNDIRFGGYGYLKWVQAVSCMWFSEPNMDDCSSYYDVAGRWWNSFKGVHTVMGHEARTFDPHYPNEMSMEFWTRWCNQNYTISSAWISSQIKWVYEEYSCPGLIPASVSHNITYSEKLFSQEEDGLAPYGLNYIAREEVGSPVY
jgi:hypothetical protein